MRFRLKDTRPRLVLPRSRFVAVTRKFSPLRQFLLAVNPRCHPSCAFFEVRRFQQLRRIRACTSGEASSRTFFCSLAAVKRPLFSQREPRTFLEVWGSQLFEAFRLRSLVASKEDPQRS